MSEFADEKPIIQTHGLSKTYGGGSISVEALKPVSIQIQTGEMVAVMGPSGSGKSTFMNLLGCLDRPTTGTYELDGASVQDLSDADLAKIRNERLGFVFQSFHLLPRLTALANVELPLTYASNSVRRDRAQQVLAQIGLADRAHHRPGELSGGQQQRVAIARALVNSPAAILADEPTGALDSTTSAEIMRIFQRLNDDGATVLVVTHEEEVARRCKRILRFLDGNLVDDSPVVDRIVD